MTLGLPALPLKVRGVSVPTSIGRTASPRAAGPVVVAGAATYGEPVGSRAARESMGGAGQSPDLAQLRAASRCES